MHGLTEMTKVEFVVPGRDAPSIRALITAAGATGYTAVSGVSGIGHHGQHSGALLFNDYDTLTMLITVLPPRARRRAHHRSPGTVHHLQRRDVRHRHLRQPT